MPNCPDCGNTVESSHNFCRSCGTELDFSQDPQCPDCGAEVSAEQNFCRECGTELTGASGGSSQTGNADPSASTESSATDTTSSGPAAGDLASHLDCEPQGDWVTADRAQKIADLLRPDEKLHYMTKGGTIDVEGSGAGESLFGNDRSRKSSMRGVWAGVTDQRVVVHIPQLTGDDERSVPYEAVTTVDLDTGLVNKRYSLQGPGQTYHIQATNPGKEECREMVQFIRTKVAAANRSGGGGEAATDPTEQLKNIADLHDQGILSDEEYEAKRKELLDKI